MYTLALEIYKELENIRDTAWTDLYLIQPFLASSADTSNVSGIIKEAIEIFSEIGDKTGLAEAYSKLGHYEEKLGNFSRARMAIEKSLEIARENNDEFAVCVSLMELGFLKLDEGNPERAQSLFLESFKLELSLDFSLSYAIGTFIALSGSAIGLGKPQRAAVLLGALKAHYLDKGFILHPVSAQQYSDYRAAAESQLDDGTYQQAWNKGLAMDPDEAIAYALEADSVAEEKTPHQG
jgi:tetratricopeptide (TPR) repeat protein